jgi:hypothetical protein
MPNISSNEGFHFCIESDNFDEDYHYLKSAGVQVDTLPHPAGARISTEQTWQRAVFIGPITRKLKLGDRNLKISPMSYFQIIKKEKGNLKPFFFYPFDYSFR